MKINKNSLHFKWANFMTNGHLPKNICEYLMIQVSFVFLACLFIYTFLLIGCLNLLGATHLNLKDFTFLIKDNFFVFLIHGILVFFFQFCLLVMFLLIAIPILYFCIKGMEKIYIDFIKPLKNKYCKTIGYE